MHSKSRLIDVQLPAYFNLRQHGAGRSRNWNGPESFHSQIYLPLEYKAQICDSCLRAKLGKEVQLQEDWKELKQVLLMKSREMREEE